MNQPQRMAPVGTDKELSDLLDFSMVSQGAAFPGSRPDSVWPAAPGFLGQKHLPEIPQKPRARPQTWLGGGVPGGRGAGGYGVRWGCMGCGPAVALAS